MELYGKTVNILLEDSEPPSLELTIEEERFVNKLYKYFINQDYNKGLGSYVFTAVESMLKESFPEVPVDSNFLLFEEFAREITIPSITPFSRDDQAWSMAVKLTLANPMYEHHHMARPNKLYTLHLPLYCKESKSKDVAIEAITFFYLRSLYEMDTDYTVKLRKNRERHLHMSKDTQQAFGDFVGGL